jgi:hypothetical protein
MNWWSDRKIKKRRGLFRYHDGSRWRYADPFAAWRSILNHPTFNIETMAHEIDAGGEPETTICIEAMCEVFDLKRWDKYSATGLTDWQVLAVLDQFDTYLTSVKKNSSRGQTLSEPTASESSTSRVPQEPTTNPLSDSTSVETESISEGGTSQSAP